MRLSETSLAFLCGDGVSSHSLKRRCGQVVVSLPGGFSTIEVSRRAQGYFMGAVSIHNRWVISWAVGRSMGNGLSHERHVCL